MQHWCDRNHEQRRVQQEIELEALNAGHSPGMSLIILNPPHPPRSKALRSRPRTVLDSRLA